MNDKRHTIIHAIDTAMIEALIASGMDNIYALPQAEENLMSLMKQFFYELKEYRTKNIIHRQQHDEKMAEMVKKMNS